MGKNMFIEIDNERFLTDILFDQTKLIPVEPVEKDGKWITLDDNNKIDIKFTGCIKGESSKDPIYPLNYAIYSNLIEIADMMLQR